MTQSVTARYFCYPSESEMDEALAEDEDRYCWDTGEIQVDEETFSHDPPTALCPRCGQIVEVEAVTAFGTFKAAQEGSDGP